MERGLTLLAILGAAGQYEKIPDAARSALAAGIPATAIRETLVFLVPYCGWPTALNALMAAASAIPDLLAMSGATDLDQADRPHRRSLGLDTARTVNDHFDQVADKIKAVDPALVDHLLESAYGYLYNRPGLDLRERELLAVAMLAIQRHERQLRYHLRGARNAGATDEEIGIVMMVLDDVDPEVAVWARDVWIMMSAQIDS